MSITKTLAVTTWPLDLLLLFWHGLFFWRGRYVLFESHRGFECLLFLPLGARLSGGWGIGTSG